MASSLTKRLDTLNPWLRLAQLRFARTESGPPRRRSKSPSFSVTKPNKEKSEWWIVDGEMHEIGDHVPPRERFVIPRDNIPNKRRKQLREQFMRRTRLLLKDSVSLSLTLLKPIACCYWNFFLKKQKHKSLVIFFLIFLFANGKEHEVFCKRYMELYQELRENWERLYWDEGYSKKLAKDHANYDSAEEDDQDFNPYRYLNFFFFWV